MTTSLPSAARAAAEEIACRVSLTGQHAEAYSDIILRHVEPIVRAVEAELQTAKDWAKNETATRDLAVQKMNQALAKLAEVQGKLNYSEVGRQAAVDDRNGWKQRAKQAERERDSALTRADSAEALLREALSMLKAAKQQWAQHTTNSLADDCIASITSHLANRGTP